MPGQRDHAESGATCQSKLGDGGTEAVGELREVESRGRRVRRIDGVGGRERERETPFLSSFVRPPRRSCSKPSLYWSPLAGASVPANRRASSHLLDWTLSASRADVVSHSAFIPRSTYHRSTAGSVHMGTSATCLPRKLGVFEL